MFHSAEEKRVLSIDLLIILPEIFKLTSSLMFGIRGNSEASIHLIFNFQLEVLIFKLLSFNNSIVTSSS
jgi:hypothetical protein